MVPEPEKVFNVLFKCVHNRTHLAFFLHERVGGTGVAGKCDDGASKIDPRLCKRVYFVPFPLTFSPLTVFEGVMLHYRAKTQHSDMRI